MSAGAAGTRPGRDRADRVLAARGLAPSREKAQALIMAGLVWSGGRRIDKPGTPIAPDAAIEVRRPLPYVGRGGLKLAGALDALGLDPGGRVCADIGASTGGFTDVLLQRGAALVYAVDVNVGQIDSRLRADPRVILVEKNARFLTPADLEAAARASRPGEGAGPTELPGFMVMDVSFISVLKVLPTLKRILEKADKPGRPVPPLLLALVKPQFEAGRAQAGSGRGIVRDPVVHAQVLLRVIEGAEEMGYRLRGLARSPEPGRRGNREFFALLGLAGPRDSAVEPGGRAVIESVREVVGHGSGRGESD